jgi:D-alanyl-lipoteichoic acid acyltransferase DltB (MBOAT superfamily)
VGITSSAFALFVAATLAVYFVLPRRGQLWLLLLASYGFYGTFSWPFPFVLAALALCNYGLGRALFRGAGRGWLGVGIAVNVASLALLKYPGFYLPGLMNVLGLTPAVGPDGAAGATGAIGAAGTTGAAGALAAVLLPIGLSYRVLENISFLVDAARRQFDAFPRLAEYALYAGWFPKLLSGPIERGRAFFAQLERPRVLDNGVVARGLTLVALGLLRKLVIADTLRDLVPAHALDAPFAHSGWQLFFWLLVDVFIVYNDFAGYTDIVRGVSSFFGIELARNFEAPFFARNFSEFWLRWHMSLSFWLRDYVFMPVSRALLRRSASPNTIVNLTVPPLAAMLVSALWHQAAWHILAWGALWGVFLFLGRLPTLWRPVVPPDRQPPWRQALGTFGVIAMLIAGNVLFKLPLADVGPFLGRAFATARWTSAAAGALLLLAISLGIDLFQHRSKDEAVFARWPLWARSLALAAVVLAVFVLTRGKAPAPFIYQGF